MSGAPDPKLGRRRIVDPAAVKVAALRDRECAACGDPAANAHHILPKDRGGDDVPENIVGLCGSGTSGCHGAFHGSPYVVTLVGVSDAPTGATIYDERRDRAWVAERIGRTLARRRGDTIAYVLERLGHVDGWRFLTETYAVEPWAGERG